MRKGHNRGPCADCGTNEQPGLYWRSVHIVLDFGVPSIPPVEPGDLGEPIRCDRCETIHCVREAYRDNLAFAQSIYCAATPADALKLLGVK